MTSSPWWTAEEACIYLRRSTPTAKVYFNFLCRSGKIKAKKVMSEWLTRQEWLDAFINGARKGA